MMSDAGKEVSTSCRRNEAGENPSSISQNKNPRRPLIFVSVGDISAQSHAIRVVKCLRKYDVSISSVGGEAIAGVSDIFVGDTISLETFGFTPSPVSVLGLWKIYKKVTAHLKRERPSAVLLVDFFGFNSKIAAAARALYIPVYYYIPPQIWATRYGRIKKIKKYVDKVFLTLPFEEDIYRREGIAYEYVGHPLVEKIPLIETLPQANNGVEKNPPHSHHAVGFFPGSRTWVIKRHIPVLNEVARLLKYKIPGVEINLFGLSSLKDVYRSVSAKDIKIIFDSGVEEWRRLDCALSVSGTIATELALMKIPSVIFYQVGFLNAFILRSMIKTKYVALPNIILGKEIYPEYLEDKVDPRSISDALAGLIGNRGLNAQIRSELGIFRRKLEPPAAYLKETGGLVVSQKVADSIMKDILPGDKN